MKECDYNHLILYAKGWYQRGDDVVKDVKKILGHRCAIDPEYISNRDVWEQLVDVFLKYCKSEYGIRCLLLDVFKPQAKEQGPLVFWTNTASFEGVIHLILDHLVDITVMEAGVEILHLGEPDPDILPLSRQAKKKLNK